MKDAAVSRIQAVREVNPGEFVFNTVMDARGLIIQNLASAVKDGDGMNFG